MQILNETSHLLNLGDVQIYCSINGEGPPLVIHTGGPGIDPRSFNDFGGLNKGFTLIIIHPRGCGLSSEPSCRNAYSFQHFASDLNQVVNLLNLDKFYLYGHSHGSFVAQLYAASEPHRVKALILSHSASNMVNYKDYTAKQVSKKSNESWYENAIKAAYALDGVNFTEDYVNNAWIGMLPFYFCSWKTSGKIALQNFSSYKLRPNSLRYHSNFEFESFDFSYLLAKIKLPTLILTGRYDIVTPVCALEDLSHKIPNSKTAIFEKSGHFSFLEEPENHLKLLQNFIGECNEN